MIAQHNQPPDVPPSSSSATRLLIAALGLTTVDFLWIIKPAVEPSQRAFYHWSGTTRTLFAPIVLDMLAAWLIVTLIILMARRAGRLRVAIWTGLLLLTPWFVVLDLEFLFLIRGHSHLRRDLFAAAFVITLALTALWRPAFSEWFEPILSATVVVLFFAGLFGLFLFCRLGWYGLQDYRMEQRTRLQPAPPSTIQPHRLIWIVLDELSYRQVYEHRYAGLQLPAFDQLASQSTVFSHAVPIGIETEYVLPGLLAGENFDAIRTSPQGVFSFHRKDLGTWEVFNQHNTSFQDARNDGYGTGIAGWYNPYCPLMPNVLNQCMWSNNMGPNGMVPAGSIGSNTMVPVEHLLTELIHLAPAKVEDVLFPLLHIRLDNVKTTADHVDDYKLLYAASNQLIRDRSAGFILLHLPVPHPGGIYDRKRGDFAARATTYLDNLALADQCLAGFRKTLQDSGQWDSSTIVVMGDHSWRTKQLWEATKAWSASEQQASEGGGYDDRPVYLVKLPDQTTRNNVDAPFQAVNTRKLFDAVMLHQINTPADLNAWLQTVQ